MKTGKGTGMYKFSVGTTEIDFRCHTSCDLSVGKVDFYPFLDFAGLRT